MGTADTVTLAAETAGTGADDIDIAFVPAGTGSILVGANKLAYGAQAVTVDGATTFAVTSSYITLACTGAEAIDTITGGVTGMRLYIEHTDTDCTLNDDDAATAADAIDLTGAAANDVGAAKKVITLIYNGTDWLQVGESDN